MRPGRAPFFWLAILVAFLLLFSLLRPILLPFLLGMALAYFLDPVVRRLEQRGLSRTLAAGLIILGAIALSTLGLVLVTPIVATQVAELASRLPGIVSGAYGALKPYLTRAVARIQTTPAGDLTTPLVDAVRTVIGDAGLLAAAVLSRGLAVVNLLSLLAVTPLVAFYLLRDWPRIVAELDGWLPRPQAETIRQQLREIDRVLAGFARGSFVVCLVLAAFYSIALSLVGLDFGLVIGLTAGAVSFVPYLGFAIGIVSSVGVALYQFWPDWFRVAVVLGIFLGGQLATDYWLTPRLVGTQVGLHPLWVIFAVFAGAALFGFVGMLVAVPACAAIGVLTRFAIAQYKASELYRGTTPPSASAP